jgi:hypothetical protein
MKDEGRRTKDEGTTSKRDGIDSLSLRERVRVRGIAERYRHFASPHPGPLPEGEGVLR